MIRFFIGTKSAASTRPEVKATTFFPASAIPSNVRSSSAFNRTKVIPPSSTAAVVASASRTKISTSQSRHFRIAYANASGIRTRGTTERPERNGDARPRTLGNTGGSEERREPTETPRPIQRPASALRRPRGGAGAGAPPPHRGGREESSTPPRGASQAPAWPPPSRPRSGAAPPGGRGKRRPAGREAEGDGDSGSRAAAGRRGRNGGAAPGEARGRNLPRAGTLSRSRRAVRPASPRRLRRTKGRAHRRAAPLRPARARP